MKAIAERVELPADQGGLGGLESPASPFTQESMESLCDDYLDGLNQPGSQSIGKPDQVVEPIAGGGPDDPHGGGQNLIPGQF